MRTEAKSHLRSEGGGSSSRGQTEPGRSPKRSRDSAGTQPWDGEEKSPAPPHPAPPTARGQLLARRYLGRVARDRDSEEEHGHAHPSHHGQQKRVPRVPVARQTHLRHESERERQAPRALPVSYSRHLPASTGIRAARPAPPAAGLRDTLCQTAPNRPPPVATDTSLASADPSSTPSTASDPTGL